MPINPNWMNDPKFLMGLGMLSGSGPGTSFGDTMAGGLKALQQWKLMDMQQKEEDLKKQKYEKELQDDHYRRLQAGIYLRDHPEITQYFPGGATNMDQIIEREKMIQPGTAVRNMEWEATPEGQATIRQAAQGLGLTVPQYLKIKGGVSDPAKPGQPMEPIKGSDMDEWVNPQMQTLGDYNAANSTNPILNNRDAFAAGFRPVSTEERKRMLGAKTSSAQAGSYYNDVMDFYDMTEGAGLTDKSKIQWDAFIGTDEKKANKLRTIKSRYESLGTSLARAMGEVGNMTDKDIARFVKRLPKPFADFDGFADNRTAAEMKMKSLEADLEALGITVDWNQPADKVFSTMSKDAWQIDEETGTRYKVE